MSPKDRIDPELYRKGSLDCRRAAVLFLLYPHQGELHTLLTVRPETMPNHPGQVAFPGGSRDDEQESVLETALREGQEEVGLDPFQVEPLGRLTHIYIPPSHFCIQIQVGYTPQRPSGSPVPPKSPNCWKCPSPTFSTAPTGNPPMWRPMVKCARSPTSPSENHKLWGATAMAIAEFVVMVEEAIVSESKE